MISERKSKLLSATVLALSIVLLAGTTASAQTSKGPWVDVYWPAWELRNGLNGVPPVSAVDFSAMTEIILFGSGMYGNGGISVELDPSGVQRVLAAAKPHGTKVLLCLGGASTRPRFLNSCDAAHLHLFVHNVVAAIRDTFHLDGVDVDWEPLAPQDSTLFRNLIVALRDSLPEPYQINLSVGDEVQWTIAPIVKYVDQVNMQNYDMMGVWSGWVTWYSGSIYPYAADGSTVTAIGGKKAVPTVSGDGNPPAGATDPSHGAGVRGFLEAGIPADKIGIGSEFGGCIWKGGVMEDGNGVTKAGEAWISAPSFTADVPLYNTKGTGIMQKYYQPQYYHWDNAAKAAYLSMDNPGTSNDYFISYDDSNSVNAKFAYIKQQGLGGYIIWTMGMGYPGNGTYPLLRTVKADRLGGLDGIKSSSIIPKTPNLKQNFPNPFNPTTSITFSIPNWSDVSLRVYNVLGETVSTLVDGYLGPGLHTVVWDALQFASGVYLYRLRVGDFVQIRKMMLVK